MGTGCFQCPFIDVLCMTTETRSSNKRRFSHFCRTHACWPWIADLIRYVYKFSHCQRHLFLFVYIAFHSGVARALTRILDMPTILSTSNNSSSDFSELSDPPDSETEGDVIAISATTSSPTDELPSISAMFPFTQWVDRKISAYYGMGVSRIKSTTRTVFVLLLQNIWKRFFVNHICSISHYKLYWI